MKQIIAILYYWEYYFFVFLNLIIITARVFKLRLAEVNLNNVTFAITYCVYAMPNSRFHFTISADSCVHKRHFVNSATHES